MSSALNAIRKLGKNHRAIAFYSMGRSNGEDAFWGPADWKSHPEKCLGKGVVGVERDGDLNIVLKWASDNGVRVNANTKVYDSNALNIIACSDFNTDLCNKVLNHYTEERDVISNGKTIPGLKHTLECDAFTTWTPADVTVATKMGGFAKLASTAEYTMQMPNISIIDAAWAEAHPNEMHSIIKALGIAGDQVRSFPDAQEFAAKVSAKVYNEKDANYWLKYYRGSEEADKKGGRVKLGGSQAFNLADAAMLFGLGSDNVNRYKITYETFGTILSKMYPKEMEGMIKHDEMVDVSYLQFVLQNNDSLAKGKTEQSTMEYASGSTVTDQTSQKTYNISFALGSDVINASSYSVLDDIYNSAQISGGLTIFVYGHTDNIGDQKDGGAANMNLSKRRAQAVSNYLQKKGLTANRIQVEGYGSTKPVYGDASDSRNRCVEIIQGK
jgi:outer membrane protein OmpA-like peptidoglycan-associated protein